MNYNVIGQVQQNNGARVPLFDIPMMTDERWNQLAEENAVHNFIDYYGYEPVSVAAACEWQRQRVEQVLSGETKAGGAHE